MKGRFTDDGHNDNDQKCCGRPRERRRRRRKQAISAAFIPTLLRFLETQKVEESYTHTHLFRTGPERCRCRLRRLLFEHSLLLHGPAPVRTSRADKQKERKKKKNVCLFRERMIANIKESCAISTAPSPLLGFYTSLFLSFHFFIFFPSFSLVCH